MRHTRNRLGYAGSTFTLLLATVCGSGPWAASEGSPRPPSAAGALDYAFRFASAIHTDPKDMGQAQERVLLDFASLGATDEALKRADQVVGWHRGVVYAELAADRAREGHREEAKALLAKADSVRQQTEGWEGPRISSHIAKALALLGDVEASRRMASELAAADDQYAGLTDFTEATGNAANGGFDSAMAALENKTDARSTSWRAEGYLRIARQSGLTHEQTRRALDAARGVLEGIQGWTKAGMLQELGEAYGKIGDVETARATFAGEEAMLVALPATAALKGPMIASLARAWSEVGRADHGRVLLKKAEEEASMTLAIDQPVVYASIAAAHYGIGDAKEATRVYDRAFDATASLRNSRPRALAAVEVCRSMALTKVDFDPRVRSRLDQLFQGLGDPW